METFSYTAFLNGNLLAQGNLEDVVLKIKKQMGKADHSEALLFNDSTGKVIDFNYQGSKEDVEKRLEVYKTPTSVSTPTGPGRPKLGVVSREVSLLPRHWEWLAAQPGGASATLRLLIEEARKKTESSVSIKQLQERTYQVMFTLAGDLEGYEESVRALYKKDRKSFLEHQNTWPSDVKKYILKVAQGIF